MLAAVAGGKDGEKGRSAAPTEDPSDDSAPESDGDSTSGEGGDSTDAASESAQDSSTTATTDAGASSADQPARIPAWITWSIVGLLAIAIAGSAAVNRARCVPVTESIEYRLWCCISGAKGDSDAPEEGSVANSSANSPAAAAAGPGAAADAMGVGVGEEAAISPLII